MVDVIIDDRHPRDARCARVGGRDGDVVEEAEAHRAMTLGVMSRRADERERGLLLARHRPLHGIDARPGSEPRDFV